MSDIIERFLLAAKKYERQRRKTWRILFPASMVTLILLGWIFTKYFFDLIYYVSSLKFYGLLVFYAPAIAAFAAFLSYIFVVRDMVYAEIRPVSEWGSTAVRLFHGYHHVIAAQMTLLPLLFYVFVRYQLPSCVTVCELMVLGLCFAVAYLLYVHRGLPSPEERIVYTLLFFMSNTHEIFKDPILHNFRYRRYSVMYIVMLATGFFTILSPFCSCQQAIDFATTIKWNLGLANYSSSATAVVEKFYMHYISLALFWIIITALIVLYAILLYKIDRCLFKR